MAKLLQPVPKFPLSNVEDMHTDLNYARNDNICAQNRLLIIAFYYYRNGGSQIIFLMLIPNLVNWEFVTTLKKSLLIQNIERKKRG